MARSFTLRVVENPCLRKSKQSAAQLQPDRLVMKADSVATTTCVKDLRKLGMEVSLNHKWVRFEGLRTSPGITLSTKFAARLVKRHLRVNFRLLSLARSRQPQLSDNVH